jgi:hypothetical protein
MVDRQCLCNYPKHALSAVAIGLVAFNPGTSLFTPHFSFTRPPVSMLGDYKVNRCTRQCHVQGRPLREGEWYYSVIIESGDDYQRHDYSAESWTEPPQNAIGWWKKRMPKADEKKMVLAPPEVLIDLLREMERFTEKAKSRYLLALMLMRKRLLRPAAENNDAKILVVEVVSDASQIEIPVCQISRSESETLRDELNALLYCEAASEAEDEEAASETEEDEADDDESENKEDEGNA